jgi:L-lactate dehydrogenase complex protein LldF
MKSDMRQNYKEFLEKSEIVSNDTMHRKTIKFNMSKYDAAVLNGSKRYKDIEAAKRYVAYKKRMALSNIESNLENFERKITGRGASVFWASDAKIAEEFIIEILKENEAKMVVKSKSMTTEEIEFNQFAQANKVNSVETDLGEYIVQIAGEKPYHIVTPAMHKSKSDVNKLFNEKFGLDLNLSAEEITSFVREKLRNYYLESEVGVTGANFIIADIGAVAVTENEGNAIMSTAFPKVHIVIAGIEKVIPEMKDLGLCWPVLAAHGTGQAISVYNSIFSGPKRNIEDFGPDKMYVILLDNQRSRIFNQKTINDSLACIRCGACLNACPVYRNIGGYTYKTTYGGPIGSVISPFLMDFKDFSHLSYACSICGKCTEVCPSKIDLHLLLLHNRREDIDKYSKGGIFKAGMKIFKLMALNMIFFDFGNAGFKNFFIKNFAKNLLGNRRGMPLLKKSFRKSFKS